MVYPKQAAKPSKIATWLAAKVATVLSLDAGFVRIVTGESDKWPVWATEPLSASVWLGPPRVGTNPGAGRYATFISRTAYVSLWVRNALDAPGDETKGVVASWDYEDTLVSALQLMAPTQTEIDSDNTLWLHKPIQLSSDSSANRLIRVDGAKFKLTVAFEVQYSAYVTV